PGTGGKAGQVTVQRMRGSIVKTILVGTCFALLLSVSVSPAAAQESPKAAPKPDPAAAKDPQAKQEPPKQDPAADSPRYRIGKEDVLRVGVWKNDGVRVTVAVRPDGRISLPLLGDVEAAGRTPTELRDLLTLKLADFVAAPEVSVVVTDVQSLKVSVIGEVPKPGRYDLKS